MEENNHLEGAGAFFDKAIKELAKGNLSFKVLDFGCGSGQLARDLQSLGYDVYGCDVYLDKDSDNKRGYLKKIETEPYKLPFDDDTFDIVISTSVLEHAQNTQECFYEIYRVLKPGGYAMHLLPGKYYLPTEPHIFVPLVSWFWPAVPNWWLALWAFLGVRNEFQKSYSWQKTYELNKSYCKKHLCYRTTKFYNQLCKQVFGNFSWPMLFYINESGGGLSRLARKLPFKSLFGIVSRELRMGFLTMQKSSKH